MDDWWGRMLIALKVEMKVGQKEVKLGDSKVPKWAVLSARKKAVKLGV